MSRNSHRHIKASVGGAGERAGYGIGSFGRIEARKKRITSIKNRTSFVPLFPDLTIFNDIQEETSVRQATLPEIPIGSFIMPFGFDAEGYIEER